MSPLEKPGRKPVWIEVSRDHFSAYLHVSPSVNPSLEDIKEVLRESKVSYGLKEDEKIDVFLNNMDLYDYTLVIASGKPFTQGRDASIVFNFELDSRTTLLPELSDSDKVDFKNIGAIASVKKGEAVAKKVPAEQGTEGITVYGQKLPGEWGMDITLKAGRHVSLSEDGTEYISDIDGAPIVSGDQIRVDPVYIVEGDVGYQTGNISFPGTIAVRGSILDGFEVQAGGDVIVENTIQSSNVSAGGDVVVKRGILTRGKGTVSAEGRVLAKFIENSIVEAEGNVVVETAIMNSQIYTNNRVIALTEDGAIIGGRILAFDRIICRNLGSQAHPQTSVQVGYRFDVQRKYLEMLAKISAVARKMAELQKNYEYVSNSDPNNLDKLGDIRGKILKLDRVKKQMQEDIVEVNATRIFNNLSMVEVEQTMYPGVYVYINDSCYNVKKEISFSSIKWDIDQKAVYLSSFDQSGREIRKKAEARAKSVLIVDDSKAVRKTLRLVFEKMGLNVVDEAEDGLVGVEKFKKHKPSLVTCDIAMVNMNGLETLKAIRAENPRAKVIMISSIKDKKKVYDCIVAGAFDYILKPFVPHRVVTVVKGALEEN